MNKKRILTLVICGILAFAMVAGVVVGALQAMAAGTNVIVSVVSNTKTARRGGTITVTVDITSSGFSETGRIKSINNLGIVYPTSKIYLKSAVPVGKIECTVNDPVVISYNTENAAEVSTIPTSGSLCMLTFGINDNAALGACGISISVNECTMLDSESGNISVSAGAAFSFDILEAKSADSALSTLSIKEGNITPEFKPEITEYMAVVDNYIDEVTPLFETSDSAASVNVENPEILTVDADSFLKIIVTAENGISTTYTITIKRLDKDNGEQLSDNKQLKELQKMFLYVIIGTGIIILALIIVIVVISIKLGKKKNKGKTAF